MDPSSTAQDEALEQLNQVQRQLERLLSQQERGRHDISSRLARIEGILDTDELEARNDNGSRRNGSSAGKLASQFFKAILKEVDAPVDMVGHGKLSEKPLANRKARANLRNRLTTLTLEQLYRVARELKK